MFDINIIRQHSFCGSIVTDTEVWSNESIALHGEFPA